MRMTAYLAGDTDVFAVRSARHEDVRVSIEFPDTEQLLNFTVTQQGQVLLSSTGTHLNDPRHDMWLIGEVLHDGAFAPLPEPRRLR